jgi:hypothetical protein
VRRQSAKPEERKRRYRTMKENRREEGLLGRAEPLVLAKEIS